MWFKSRVLRSRTARRPEGAPARGVAHGLPESGSNERVGAANQGGSPEQENAPELVTVKSAGAVRLRQPRVEDGAAMWELVRASESLDLNSPYAYLLVGSHFAGTSVVAERAGEIVAFVAAYAPPGRPDTLFVWQVGVAAAARGAGLASRLLERAVAAGGFRFLEATITPSNAASWALFRGFARRHGVACRESPCFSAAHFPGAGHEGETLVRIGPLR